MKQTTFQLIVLVVFGFLAAASIFVFSGIIPIFKSSDKISGEVVIWGTIPQTKILKLIEEVGRQNSGLQIFYVEKSEANFDKDFIEALAAGKGPDAFFFSQDFAFKYADKLFVIPYSSLSERDFRNTYVDEAELFLSKNGVLGLPIYVDPMVMYWNRSIFSSSGISKPPSYWDEFAAMVPRIVKRDKSGNITSSAVALGEWKNISHAKDILATLIIQAGAGIVERASGYGEEKAKVSILTTQNVSVRPADSALRFFTEFSDAVKPTYSWNKSLSNSTDSFVAERLGLYFGYASEFLPMRSKNPHLNFDVVSMPQARGSATKTNFGMVYSIGVTRAAKNPEAAFFAATKISAPQFSGKLAENLFLAPARRDLLAVKNENSYLQFFNESALTARAWLDPMPELTDAIFKEMIESVVSGSARVSEAVMTANEELSRLIR
ncbi:MAG: extracellular solute-binding protein [Patescibacteria group bacterium]